MNSSASASIQRVIPKKSILILGGGFGGLYTALELANQCLVALAHDLFKQIAAH